MMTAIGMLKVAGLLVATLVARGALVVAVIMVLSLPLIAYAYGVRAVRLAWSRHHDLGHPRHHHA